METVGKAGTCVPGLSVCVFVICSRRGETNKEKEAATQVETSIEKGNLWCCVDGTLVRHRPPARPPRALL
jgi:hypothetical protein